MINSEELAGIPEYLTLWMRCRINRCRCNRVRLCMEVSDQLSVLGVLIPEMNPLSPTGQEAGGAPDCGLYGEDRNFLMP
jgi:hypothetical protein